MSGVQQRLKLKQTPIDTWSLKEHLTLASAVLKNGDQNWVSVSRTMKQLGEAGRPADWFKDKNCALQYNLLLEKADIPIRKRGEKTDCNETPAQRIVNKLAQERIAELKIILEQERLEILKLEAQTTMLSSDDTTEEQLDQVLAEVEAEEAAEDAREEEALAWLQSREEKKQAIQTALKSGIHRARFGQAKQQPFQVSQSQMEQSQSGSELDSAQDSPTIDTQDPGDHSENVEAVESMETVETVDSDSQPLDVESLPPTQPPPTGCETPVVSSSPSSSPLETTGPSGSPLLTSLLQSPRVASTGPGGPPSLHVGAQAPSQQCTAPPSLHTGGSPGSLQSPTSSRPSGPGSSGSSQPLGSPIKCAAISHLAQKLASGTGGGQPFCNPVLADQGIGMADTGQSSLALGKEEDDLTETLSDLDELLKKELEESTKEEPELTLLKVETELEPKKETELGEIKQETKEEDLLESLCVKPDEMEEKESKNSRRPGRPRKSNDMKIEEAKANNPVEEDVDAKKEDKSSAPTSPELREDSPSPEVGELDPIGEAHKESVTSKDDASVEVPLEEDVVAPSPPSGPTEEEVRLDSWRQEMLTLLDRILKHKSAGQFAEPVSEHDAPEYRDMIYRPMDLRSIRKNVESGHILTTEGVSRDLNLMFLNSIMYNSSDHENYNLTLEMQMDTNRMVREIMGSEVFKLDYSAFENMRRGSSSSGAIWTESPVSSRSRTVSQGSETEKRKRERTSSAQEEGTIKKRRLRTIEEN